MAEFGKWLSFLQDWEGGFSDDKADRGGQTKYGVTLATYTALAPSILREQNPTAEKHKNLSPSDASRIILYYWNKVEGSRINDQALANALADWYFHSGFWAVHNLHKVLNKNFGTSLPVSKKEGGKWKPVTFSEKSLTAVNSANPSALFDYLSKERESFLRHIVTKDATQERFLNGWLNRLNDLVKKKGFGAEQ
ncbi:MAG: glycoside hydrolase family 108 protein [Bacteroidia bacterium]